MLELHRDSQTLEDVFRSLTIGDERRNRHLSVADGGTASNDADDEDDEDEDDEDDRPGAGSSDVGDKAAKAVRS